MLHHPGRNSYVLLWTIVFFGMLANGSATERARLHASRPENRAAPSMQAADTTALDVATAMDIPAESVVSASLGNSDPQGVHVFSYQQLGGFPVRGNSFAAISTGKAADASIPNNPYFTLSTALSGLNNSRGSDLVQLTLTLAVPPGARYWAIDRKFFSEEFPTYVGQAYNDAFFVETPSSNIVITGSVPSSNNNVDLDPFGSRASINSTGATGMLESNAIGTGYNGATKIVTTSAKIPDGATQITIVFSITDLGDSSNDTAVFLDNFRFLTEFIAPPNQDPPNSREIVIDGTIAPDKPTVVITHGLENSGGYDTAPYYLWTGPESRQAAGLIRNELYGNVNIVHLVWRAAFDIGKTGLPADYSYNAAQPFVHDAGEYLGNSLAELLGSSYHNPIHFIGHSLGTIVNAYAARAFLEKATNVKSAQLTSLDRPDHVTASFPGCGAFPGCRGYTRDFLGDLFRDLQTRPGRDLNLIFDNYYSTDSNAVGDITTGLGVYNHGQLIQPWHLNPTVFHNETINSNHSGVHEFYRWTMNPNGLYPGVCGSQTTMPPELNSSLDPCNKGWKYSIVRTGHPSLPTQNMASTSTKSSLPINLFHNHGCSLTGTTATCIEPVSIGGLASAHLARNEQRREPMGPPPDGTQSTTFGIAEVSIPANANGISFKYRFVNVEDGDYASIYLDNVLIWTFSGSSYSGAGAFLDSGTIPIAGLTGNRSLSVVLYGVGSANAQFEVKDVSSVSSPSLSLNQSRFKVEVTWSTGSGSSGVGTPVQLTSDSGYFWFFGNTNVELVVKLLDGRATNGRFWFFWGAMTDVQYTITVTDTQTGAVRHYQGVQGVQQSGNDINAFADTGAASGLKLDAEQEIANFEALLQAAGSAVAANAPAPPPNPSLELNNSRFSVQVSWSTPSGSSGVGTPVQLTSDSGYFWFFGDTNVELLVKVLDGRGTNGHFWFFWGAMTDVQYAITVTDTQTGVVKYYYGVQGVQQSGNDINAFTDAGAASETQPDAAQALDISPQ